MPATPTYDTVIEDLQIDPERIAARPAWSFEIAERVRKHRKKVLKSTAPRKRRRQQTRANQSPAKQVATKRATAAN